MKLDLNAVPTPCFVVDETALQRNLDILASVRQRTGARILLALKGFAMFSLFPQIRTALDGTCASSPHEARLGREEFGGQVTSFSAAYSQADMAELVQLSDHIIFNSFAQWRRFRPLVEAAGRDIHCGLRINPEYAEVKVELYNPCARFSRLGITLDAFEGQDLAGISGLHFHTMCEQNADTLARTLEVVEAKFGHLIPQMQWVNFGGGHHITRPDYDVDLLCQLVSRFQDRYGVQVYLEPGEAVALNTGVLVSTVLDIVHNGMDIALLDTSACAHMPDVIEMPYRPEVVNAGLPGQYAHTYRLGGPSCLAGDVIGDYSFAKPLKAGDKLVFLDMAHYTMVKTNTFNGIRLPSIAIGNSQRGDFRLVRQFGYQDFKGRLS